MIYKDIHFPHGMGAGAIVSGRAGSGGARHAIDPTFVHLAGHSIPTNIWSKKVWVYLMMLLFNINFTSPRPCGTFHCLLEMFAVYILIFTEVDCGKNGCLNN